MEDFNDGHTPGGSTVSTKLVKYKDKISKEFMVIFENALEEKWCDLAYEFAFKRKKPWGNELYYSLYLFKIFNCIGSYVTMAEVNDPTISAEEFWEQGAFEKAISLVAVRSMVATKGKELVGVDPLIYGAAVWCLTSNQSAMVDYHLVS